MRSGRSGTVRRVGSTALSSELSVRCSPAPRAEAEAKRPQSSAAIGLCPGSEGDAQRGGKDEQRRPSTHRGTPRSSLRAGLGPDGRGGGVPRRALRSGPGRAYRLSVAATAPTGAGCPCPGAEPSAERSPRPLASQPARTSQRSRPGFAVRSRQDGAAGSGSARGPAPRASPFALAAAAATAMVGVGGCPGRLAGALRGRLHLRRGLGGLQWARAGDAAPGLALLDAEPVSISFAACPGAVTGTRLRVCTAGEGAECFSSCKGTSLTRYPYR